MLSVQCTRGVWRDLLRKPYSSETARTAFDQSDIDRRRTHVRTTGTTVIDSDASCPGAPGCELGVEHEHR